MSMKKSTFDAVIVGGGAAGLFAAVQASARGRRILLLEKNSRCGKKLLITGKGRCNVTNACTAEEALKNIPRNGRFLYSAMAAFPPEAAMAFFEQGGCPLKVERGNRVFPVSDRSADVLNVLERAAARRRRAAADHGDGPFDRGRRDKRRSDLGRPGRMQHGAAVHRRRVLSADRLDR